jgi:hypothetical protein
VLVLEEGMKYSRVGMTMEDAQYIDTKKMNRVEIATIYRVPPYKIGAADKVSYNSMEQAALEFVTDCIVAWCTRMELAFERDLVRADQTYFVRFNVNALLRGDLKSRYEAYAKGREAGFLSVDDVRAMEDMNPIKGPGGDEYIRPMNFVPLGTPAQQTAKPPAAENREVVDMILALLKLEQSRMNNPPAPGVTVLGSGASLVHPPVPPAKVVRLVHPVMNEAGKVTHFEVHEKEAAK